MPTCSGACRWLPGRGAWFAHGGGRIEVRDVVRLDNAYLQGHAEAVHQNEVFLRYEDKAVVRKGEGFILLREMSGDLDRLRVGDRLA